MITQLQSGKARTPVQALLVPETAPILLSYPDSLSVFVGPSRGQSVGCPACLEGQ